MNNQECDVVVIGAGPAGAIASSLLNKNGWKVIIVEKQHFPRFSIGESLLPQCMDFIEKADMLDAFVESADELGFQYKNGAAFYRAGETNEFDFRQKFSEGPPTTFQVKRASFDKLLADQAESQGVEVRYGHAVSKVEVSEEKAVLDIDTDTDDSYQLTTKFILDASGFGRVLPRLLDLEAPTELFHRQAIFCHVKDNIPEAANFDRNKILITVHPEIKDVWYWLIPFSDGTASLGVVVQPQYLDENKTDEQLLKEFVDQDDNLSMLLADAEYMAPFRKIGGYSASVKSLYGQRFALLGNAGEFLDPVFSSGVTIAMKSSVLAAESVHKALSGAQVDWEQEYAEPLMKGVKVFKKFVMSWYDTSLQQVIFFQNAENEVKPMITSILAGYAWDETNPFVANTERGVNVLVKLCED